MSSTPSSLLKLQLPDIGTEDDTWGDILNDNVFSRLEQAAHGEAPISVLGSNITLDDTQYLGTESHKSVLKLTGAQTADIDIIVPARTHNYIVLNDTTDGGGGPWTVTVKVTGQTGVALSHGARAILYANGTDVETILSTETVQPKAALLTALAALTAGDGEFVVGDGSTFVEESGATARASLGIDGASKVLVAGDYEDGSVGPDALADTAVTPGTYPNANVTVDSSGRITDASTTVGPYKLIQEQTASSSSYLDFTTDIDSTYDDYLVILDGILPSTDDAVLYLLVSYDGGSTFETTAGAYAYGLWEIILGASSGTEGSASTTYIALTDVSAGGGIGTAAGENGWFGDIRFSSPDVATQHHFRLSGSYKAANGLFLFVEGRGVDLAGTAVDAIRFIMDSGTIASGTIRLYGMSK